MAGWKDFREIAAWHHSREVKRQVYGFLARDDVKRKYKYCEQLADAARSAPSNIAEGFGRFGNKEFARFSRIAKGSLEEVLNHLIDAHDQQLLSSDELALHERRIRKALKATIGLIRHLESTTDPPRRPREPSEPPEPSEPSEPSEPPEP
jgi:four helix bundle protein